MTRMFFYVVLRAFQGPLSSETALKCRPFTGVQHVIRSGYLLSHILSTLYIVGNIVQPTLYNFIEKHISLI